MSAYPDPTTMYPLGDIDRLVFLKTVISSPLIEVGDFTYYDDPKGPEGFEQNVLYHFPFIGDRLVIGRFCQIAAETKFIMNGGNHRMDGFTTFPFLIFGGDWANQAGDETDFAGRGDTIIGNDVWIGYDALIMPGTVIGDGAIIAARSVVTKDVPPYAVVAGNPAKVVRMRFDEATVDALLSVRWWDWDIETITAHIPEICGQDIKMLKAIDETQSR